MGERAGSRGGRLAARSAAVDTQVSNFAGMACCARIADLRDVGWGAIKLVAAPIRAFCSAAAGR